ncbi:MAG: hypothetical protein ACXVBE_10075 [Bdellovibrionota bacterium]
MNNKLKIAGLLSLTVLPLSSQAAGYCYGYTCGEPKQPTQPVVNNCDDAVIQSNLAKLSALNILTVTGLAPFACYGYSCHNREEAEAQKCQKAEALAKSVQLLAPLAVPPAQL